jgi:hypothetical protein
MFAIVVHHHPVPEHLDAFRSFCVKVGDGLRDRTAGLLSIEGFDDPANARLTIVSRWDSRESAEAGVVRLIEVANEVGPRDPAWSLRQDEVFQLLSF